MAMEKEALTNTIESDLARRNRNWDKVDAHLAENATEGNPHGIDAKANKEQPAWINATLQNGWTGSLQYRMNEIGQMELSWQLTPGTTATNTLIAELPSDYTYSRNIPMVSMRSSDGTASIAFYFRGWDRSIRVAGVTVASTVHHGALAVGR